MKTNSTRRLISAGTRHFFSGIFFTLTLTAVSGTAFANAGLPYIDAQSAVGVRGDIERAMWVTNCEDIIYNVESAKFDFFNFCNNPRGLWDSNAPAFSRHPINHLFLFAKKFLAGDREEKDSLRAFIREAHTRGIRVDYLDGEPEWITTDGKDADLSMLNAVNFNNTCDVEDRFDGIMLDVQPYALYRWGTKDVWNKYVSFLNTMHATLSQSGMEFGVTIPRWYDTSLGMDAIKNVYKNVNFVLVLDYVNQERSLVESIAGEIGTCQ